MSINCVISAYVVQVKCCHARKYNCLLSKSNAESGIQSNPNNVVWNISSPNLTREEFDVLSYGLNHGFATNFSCNDILPSMESIWDQLIRNSLFRENCHSINCAKNSMRALASNLIDLDNQRVFKDKKKLQFIKEVRKDTVILKPDKGNGVVVIDTTYYYEFYNQLFSDITKFKRLYADPTSNSFGTSQSCLRKLYNRNKISEDVYQKIRPKNAKAAIAHGLSKVHKSFERVPSSRPIIDTIGSTHCNIGKYITKLLNFFTQHEYSLKDTFDAAESINKIPKN